MHAPNNCAPPVPRSDAPSIMHRQFPWEIQGKSNFCHTKSALQLCTPGQRSDVPSIMQVQTFGGGFRTSLLLHRCGAGLLCWQSAVPQPWYPPCRPPPDPKGTASVRRPSSGDLHGTLPSCPGQAPFFGLPIIYDIA